MTSLNVDLLGIYGCEKVDPFWVLFGFVSGVNVSDAISMLLSFAIIPDAGIPGPVLSRMAWSICLCMITPLLRQLLAGCAPRLTLLLLFSHIN